MANAGISGPRGHTQRVRKPHQSRPKSSTRQPAVQSQASLKKRVRDLKRLLKHTEKLPADVIQARERELVACQEEIESSKRHGGASKRMISKYHMVRFFERKKATRALQKAKRRLAANEDSSKTPDLRQEVHNRKVDLNYTLYYPLNMKYTSLFKAEGEIDAASQPLRRKEMWSVVEKATESNALEALRDGKFPGESFEIETSDERGVQAAVESTGRLNTNGDNSLEGSDQADEDDADGFFEE